VPPGSAGDLVVLRREHLRHEALLRSVGTVYYISAGLALTGAAMVLIRMMLGGGDVDEDPPGALIAFLLLMSSALVIVGRGVRELARWARIPIVVLSAIGLLAVPIGTVINWIMFPQDAYPVRESMRVLIGTLIHGFVLWLVLCAKGRKVFSQEYAAAIEQTPAMTLPRSPLPAAFVALLVGLMVFALVAPALFR